MLRFAVIAAWLAGPAVAQDLPPLADVLAEIDGREVSATGVLWKSSSPIGEWAFRVGDDVFHADLAAGREALKRAEGCELELFTDKQGCPARIQAEVSPESGRVNLIIFDIAFDG